MIDTNTKDEQTPDREETATKPTAASTPRLAGVPAVQAARARNKPEPKRLSKGQRKHVRRQKQAGEAKVIDRR